MAAGVELASAMASHPNVGYYINSYRNEALIRSTNSPQGDSGGPLVCVDERDRYVVAGVVSFGRSDCLLLPNVFTDVTKYVDWIYMNMLMNE